MTDRGRTIADCLRRILGEGGGQATSLAVRSLPRQAALQLLAFATGVVVVRSLSKPDYALYTAAMSLVAVLSVGGDLGLSSAVLAVGAQVRGAPADVAAVREAAMTMRRTLVTCAMLVVIGLGVWLLPAAGASTSDTAGLLGLTCLAGWLGAPAAVDIAVARARGQVMAVQDREIAAASCRAALLLALASVRLTPAAALLVVAVTAWLLTRLMRPGPTPVVAEKRTVYGRSLRALVARQAPASVYGILEPQIFVALAAGLGGVSVVAEFGALGRLTAAAGVLGGVMSAAVVPVVAWQRRRQALIRLYLAATGLLGIVGASVLVIGTQAPDLLLSILGTPYLNLRPPLRVAIAATFLRLLAALTYSLNAARGVIPSPWLAVGAAVLTQAMGCVLFDVSQVVGLFRLSALLAFVALGINVAYALKAVAWTTHQEPQRRDAAK